MKVIHSLTSMGCPAGPMIQENIHDVAAALPGVEEVEVELTWEPPWTPDLMSEDTKVHPRHRLAPSQRGGLRRMPVEAELSEARLRLLDQIRVAITIPSARSAKGSM